MNSAMPKVLHAFAGRSMLAHVMETAKQASFDRVALVVSSGMDAVSGEAGKVEPEVETYIQSEQLGTAHAVLAARKALTSFDGDIVVLYGDTPLLRSLTLLQMRDQLHSGADIVVLGFEAGDPTGYGRLITGKGGKLLAVREEREANSEEKAITFCNSGVFAFKGQIALGILDEIGNENAKGEYYLTDAVEIARRDGLTAVAVSCPEEEVLGVNSRIQLAQAEAIVQDRLRAQAMEGGATLIAPETVFLSEDTRLGRDVVVEQNVVFGAGVTVEEGARIRAFSHLEEAHVGKGAIIGPYARLRPGAQIGDNVRIGNFVEVKNANLADGAKVNHLSYVGDATVGKGANVGAGTITCNYDGYAKHRTDIGAGAFIGSNTALVAPVKIGDGAYVGSGSVISRNVPDNALAVTRGPLDQRENWASRMRQRRERNRGNKA